MQKKFNFFGNIAASLKKTSTKLQSKLKLIFSDRLGKIDEQVVEDMEDLMITMDFGVETATILANSIREISADQNISSAVESKLKSEIKHIMSQAELEISVKTKPHVILLCGVNGSGKTTAAAKLAKNLQGRGLSVILAACDTFRAAAVEQLVVWADKIKCKITVGKDKEDAASVAYKAIDEAILNGYDVVIIDTAGRLHNNKNLMGELEKIYNIATKKCERKPEDVILVLDATIGQNLYKQFEEFQKFVRITGLIINKIDGSAKGGVVIGLINKYKTGVYFLGTGEGPDDFSQFNTDEFANSLFE